MPGDGLGGFSAGAWGHGLVRGKGVDQENGWKSRRGGLDRPERIRVSVTALNRECRVDRAIAPQRALQRSAWEGGHGLAISSRPDGGIHRCCRARGDHRRGCKAPPAAAARLPARHMSQFFGGGAARKGRHTRSVSPRAGSRPNLHAHTAAGRGRTTPSEPSEAPGDRITGCDW